MIVHHSSDGAYRAVVTGKNGRLTRRGDELLDCRIRTLMGSAFFALSFVTGDESAMELIILRRRRGPCMTWMMPASYDESRYSCCKLIG